MPDPGGCLGWALLPLRRYAEFGGRSRRTELVAFYLLTMLVGVALAFPTFLLRSTEMELAGWLFTLAVLCPSLALGVRRLHDTGRSGWWMLLIVPGVALSLWRDFYPETALDPERMEALTGLADLASFGLLVLLLWNDDPEPNRYGPNPRYDPPEPEA